MAERTYNEAEVARIFESAAAPQPPAARGASARGLTLGELQEIGREVGLPAQRIAQAARLLDHERSALPRRRQLGMPVGAGRSAELPRALTDREWSILVADLRETFGAQGRDLSHGAARQWVNGNLHAVVEPTIDGWRLRLGTVKGDAAAFNAMGFGAITVGAAAALSMLAAGEPLAPSLLFTGAFGGGAFVFNALRLPRWASTRERQMDAVIQRALLMTSLDDRDP